MSLDLTTLEVETFQVTASHEPGVPPEDVSWYGEYTCNHTVDGCPDKKETQHSDVVCY